jgi:predicted GIY-YIG superfamily endonuclease
MIDLKKVTDKMPSLLHSLLEQPLVTIDDIGITEVPQNGVYVFFEDDKPIYVGRSNRLKKRLKEHSQSSSHYSATLAFRIAKKSASVIQIRGGKQTNQQLMENSDFVKKFKAAKERISRVRIRYIPIEDQIEQAIFEIYAHLELDTELNDFNTH